MPWKAELPGERPTLGAGVVAWIESNLASPDGREGLVELTREQVDFTLRLYELDPLTGRRRFRRAVLSRAKGWGRSPYLAMLAAAEAFCDVVPAGWDRDGRPVGKPWSAVRSVWIQVLAVSESQTKNSWLPLTEMVADGPAGKAARGRRHDHLYHSARPGPDRVQHRQRDLEGRQPALFRRLRSDRILDGPEPGSSPGRHGAP